MPFSTSSSEEDWKSLRGDNDRLGQRLSQLGHIGLRVGPKGEKGCGRLALTDLEKEGRDLVVKWMNDLELDVSVDQFGNVVGVYPGSNPELAPVMMGSHIDTVPTGGWFDGNLGVLGGLEVIETCQNAGFRPLRGLAVAFFTGEEGARFQPDMIGSLVYVGGMGLEEALDVRAVDDNARIEDELVRIGYKGDAPCPAPKMPHAFVEVHIEQGPVLEDEGTTIGVVEGVQGISWTELIITGQSCHAGTTPMYLRHDPGLVAAEITVGVRQIAKDMGGTQVAAVGHTTYTPVRFFSHPLFLGVFVVFVCGWRFRLPASDL
jgi:beta-ureidopropionase / N-carbamoyl-L-amino-acid hydrolase